METIVTVKKKNKKKGNVTSPWRQAFTRIKKNKLALFGFYILIFMFVFCFIGPFFSPYVSGTIQVTQINKPPSFLIGLVQVDLEEIF